MAIEILIADDHEIVRYGLSLLIDNEPDFAMVGQASNAAETLALLRKLRPGVLVLDLYMPGAQGLSLLEEVLREYPETRVVMMSGQAMVIRVREALQAGASGFVQKDDEAEELLRAIRAAAAGEKYLSPLLARHAYATYVENDTRESRRKLQRLTERELEIIRLAAAGVTGGDIAKQLFISPRTVETHRSRAMQKLELRNEVELVRFFVSLEMEDRYPAAGRGDSSG